MSNGHVCCILGVCCPPGSPERAGSLANELADAGLFADAAAALPTAQWLLQRFDFAPVGTLDGFRQGIRDLVLQDVRAHGIPPA